MFAFVKSSLWDRVDTDAREAFAELVADLGDRVEEVELVTPTDEVLGWQRAIGGAEIAINLGREWDKGRDKLSPALRAPYRARPRGSRDGLSAGPWPHPELSASLAMFEQRSRSAVAWLGWQPGASAGDSTRPPRAAIGNDPG